MSQVDQHTYLLSAVQEILSTSNRPTGLDCLVAAVHGVFTREGFRCVGLGESGDPVEPRPSNALPAGWNASQDIYALRYRHAESAMTFVLKLLPMAGRLLIHAMGKEAGQVIQCELEVSKYVRPGVCYEASGQLFTNLGDLYSTIQRQVTNQLCPQTSTAKSLFSAGSTAPASGPTTTPVGGGRDAPVPPAGPPMFVPGSGGGLRDDRLPHGVGGGGMWHGGGAFGTGYDDRAPGGFGAGPMFGGPGGMFGGGGGGMFVGPNHPGFGPRVTDPYAPDRSPFPGQPQRPDYSGRLPPGAFPPPPGARIDPFGPPPLPGAPPPGGSRFHPDLDPPRSMYF
eukprot:gnl/Hemi2/21304_TR7069_c0_g1_i1.p1 gnl/Hemi2/21304_TR7069_c0_g1~~gnl/Hemi2/21304_TR7069_c0_g1_i1.p1  ORF type:complete len:338 (+),score=59.99 gnl/Hemi2/21304_TR7069_c0_g1_i1:56-1069(+)